MRRAYILVTVEAGMEDPALEALRGVEGVVEAHRVFGPFDIVARVEAETLEEVRGMVAYPIRRVEGIVSTLTLLCM